MSGEGGGVRVEREVVDEDEKEERRDDGALRRARVQRHPRRVRAVVCDAQAAVAEERAQPTPRGAADADAVEFEEQAVVPHAVEGFGDVEERDGQRVVGGPRAVHGGDDAIWGRWWRRTCGTPPDSPRSLSRPPPTAAAAPTAQTPSPPPTSARWAETSRRCSSACRLLCTARRGWRRANPAAARRAATRS